MYATSQDYKELIYLRSNCLLNIYIDGNLINDDDIYSFRVSHNLFDGGTVKLGSVTSKSIELEINKKALPETYSSIYVETGLTINDKDEVVPIGYFTLEEIQNDDNVVSITAVDNMMKFEKVITSAVTGTALEILQAICNACSVELGSNSFLGSNEKLNLSSTDLTARQVIGYIAEKAGGFALIGRDGKLYIKKIGEDTTEIDINLFQDYSWGEKFVCNEVDFINDTYDFEVSDTDYSSAYLDTELDSLLYDNTIKGQPLKIGSNNIFITTEEQVQTIYDNLKELTLYGFTGQSVLDPALDIGDIIYIDEKPVVYQGDMEYLGYWKGNISSKIETEEKSNTTVQSINLTNRLKELKKQVNEKVNTDEVISTINTAIVDGENIQSEDGSIILAKDGVLTNLQFYGSTCHVPSMQSSQAGIFDTLGFEYDENGTGANTATQMLLFPKIPKTFKITKATLTIRHYTLNLWGPEGLYGFGYARNLKLYRGSNLMYRDYDIYERVYGLERTTELELIDVLGNNGYTPSIIGDGETDADEITTVDISKYISNDSFLVLKSINTIETSEDNDTNFKNCALETGLVAMILDVWGYLGI